jgi:D-proline reductase (dithiol) PrdB
MEVANTKDESMVRLADLPEWERDHMLQKIPSLPKFGITPWVVGRSLKERRVAIVTTAGLHLRGDKPFGFGDASNDYRVIPGNALGSDLVMSQLSTNFDRSGFQQDLNVAFPIDRLKELAQEGVIKSVADFHYSFMGAGSPVTRMENKAREVAGLLKKDKVDAVLLTPV